MRPLASKPSDSSQGEPRCGAPLPAEERPLHPARRPAAPTYER